VVDDEFAMSRSPFISEGSFLEQAARLSWPLNECKRKRHATAVEREKPATAANSTVATVPLDHRTIPSDGHNPDRQSPPAVEEMGVDHPSEVASALLIASATSVKSFLN
jgi:hypothetical protein